MQLSEVICFLIRLREGLVVNQPVNKPLDIGVGKRIRRVAADDENFIDRGINKSVLREAMEIGPAADILHSCDDRGIRHGRTGRAPFVPPKDQIQVQVSELKGAIDD